MAKKSKTRSQDLRARLNEALISVFLLEERDYFQDLTFIQLLKLKQGLARIHDTVTLKLTFALVDWIANRFNLNSDQKAALWKQVDDQSANASGFDLRWHEPHIIAEVKGTIPMNGGNVFGAAQLRGLTNDVRQMLGVPSLGKTQEQLSVNSKVSHPTNLGAIKLLALYDSEEIRKAVTQWKKSLEAQAWFSELEPSIQIQDAPDTGLVDDPRRVYLIYLKPSLDS